MGSRTEPPPIALIDVRSMYCSIERCLDPKLAGKALLVLANNDGAVISRTDEAKALGIAMGQPWFEIRNKPVVDLLHARSSNYAEYGAFSSRFHDIVASSSPTSEIYSQDEAFFEPHPNDPSAAVADLQHRVERWIGLPTAAGIGSNKTLAKVAQRHAKALGEPLVDLTQWSPREIVELLDATPAAEVWGIGRRLTIGLAGIGIHTAGDLARADHGVLRRRWSVVLERTARELAGVPCMPVGFTPSDRKQLIYSRMFGATVDQPDEMRSVLAQYAAAATRRLRAHGLEAALVQVWISSSRFRANALHHSYAHALDPPTADPLTIIKATRGILPKMRPGHAYNRAGLMLTGLSPAGQQPVLWPGDNPQHPLLNTAVDAVARRYGRAALGWGPTGLRAPQKWDMRREHLSPAGTTDWSQLLTVR